MELFRVRAANLGIIKKAEIGIRPLTVFIGPNNTNKTWLAYGIYSLARAIAMRPAVSPTIKPRSHLPEDLDARIAESCDELSRTIAEGLATHR